MDGTILVADDDRTIRTVLTQALTRAGCKVHATSSLMTLMRWVEEGKGDLVISDVIMPDGNGLQALPQISRLFKGGQYNHNDSEAAQLYAQKMGIAARPKGGV